MSFTRNGLARLGGANSDAGSMWLYKSGADNYATISGTDYFLDAINELKLGDTMIVVDSGAVQSITYVDSNDGSTIDIATGNTITA